MSTSFIRFYQYILSLEDSIEYSKFCIQTRLSVTEELRNCESRGLWKARGYSEEDHFSTAQLRGYIIDFKVKKD